MAEKGYKWYDDGLVLRKFCLALNEAGFFEELDDLITFLVRPWKYNEFHTAWADNGAPDSENDDGWDDFIEAISADEEEAEEEEEE